MKKLFALGGVGFVALLLAGSAKPPALGGSASEREWDAGSLDEGAVDVDAGAADAAEELACCKVCHKGQACGDSCISRTKECHQGPGCACDG